MSPKDERIEVRLSAADKAAIQEAAALSGVSLSAYIVSEVVEKARNARTTFLSLRDWERFHEMLNSDAEPTPALNAAMRKHLPDA